jgi:hypothetical protein
MAPVAATVQNRKGRRLASRPDSHAPHCGCEQDRAKHETDLRWRQPTFSKHRLGVEMHERGDCPERGGEDDESQKLPVATDDA